MGDELAPPAIDDAFGPVFMDYPIVMFQKSENSFYVRKFIDTTRLPLFCGEVSGSERIVQTAAIHSEPNLD